MLVIVCNKCGSLRIKQNEKVGTGKDKYKELLCKDCGNKMALSKIQYQEELDLN